METTPETDKRPIVAVTGSTGMQGGSVFRALAKDGGYHLRALTRNPNSKAAQVLKEIDPTCELVKIDLEEPKTLAAALKDAYLVFGMTNFFDPTLLRKTAQGEIYSEYDQGKSLVNAAIASGAKRFIWSSQDDVSASTSGELDDVFHFDNKTKVEYYLTANSDKLRSAFVYLGFYGNNFCDLATWDKDTVVFRYPLKSTQVIPFVDPETDTGPTVLYIMKNFDEYLEGVVDVASGYYTVQQVVDAFTEATGIPARYEEIPKAECKVPGLADECLYIEEYGYFRGRTDFLTRNREIPHKFSTPLMFWKRIQWKGPSREEMS